MNELLNRKNKNPVINQFKIEGHIVTDRGKIANELANKYFCEIGPKLAETIPILIISTLLNIKL